MNTPTSQYCRDGSEGDRICVIEDPFSDAGETNVRLYKSSFGVKPSF